MKHIITKKNELTKPARFAVMTFLIVLFSYFTMGNMADNFMVLTILIGWTVFSASNAEKADLEESLARRPPQ